MVVLFSQALFESLSEQLKLIIRHFASNKLLPLLLLLLVMMVTVVVMLAVMLAVMVMLLLLMLWPQRISEPF